MFVKRENGLIKIKHKIFFGIMTVAMALGMLLIFLIITNHAAGFEILKVINKDMYLPEDQPTPEEIDKAVSWIIFLRLSIYFLSTLPALLCWAIILTLRKSMPSIKQTISMYLFLESWFMIGLTIINSICFFIALDFRDINIDFRIDYAITILTLAWTLYSKDKEYKLGYNSKEIFTAKMENKNV